MRSDSERLEVHLNFTAQTVPQVYIYRIAHRSVRLGRLSSRVREPPLFYHNAEGQHWSPGSRETVGKYF